MNRPNAVIVLAAGQGTRMKSTTPKVLHDMCGRPLLGHAIVAAEESEAQHIVTVIRHQRDRVAQMVTDFAPDVILADQDEIPGTGRAVQCGLEELIRQTGDCVGTVVVTSADVPLLSGRTLTSLTRAHEEAGNAVTVVTTIVEDATGYGRIVRTGGEVTAIVEHRDATEEQLAITEINAGIYAFDAEFLSKTLPTLGTDNDQGEVYLTDTIAAAIAQARKCGAFVLEDQWQAQGCNDRVQLADLRDEMNRRILDEHMRAGVSIISPATTYVDVDVTIAADARIEPGCILEGETVVEPFSVIGPHTTLRHTHIEEGVIFPHGFAFDTRVPAGTVVDPFTEIGPQSLTSTDSSHFPNSNQPISNSQHGSADRGE
ncbi:MAG: NTP transferase domain-containing protein [Actinomycetaceae bacterium]|nr:NTP transferase domain-containing protein [Actinomycetaceae bacterium]